jgi:hypothetical protein
MTDARVRSAVDRHLATPEPIKDWPLRSLKEKLIKIGAKVASHGRYVAFQVAEVAIPRHLGKDMFYGTCLGTTTIIERA